MNQKTNPDDFAFPVSETQISGGMTIRQYFAGQAMAGLCASKELVGMDKMIAASKAASMADALIKELNRPQVIE